jgi:predicted RNase H-like nuclease (RuvC/YqgF family)
MTLVQYFNAYNESEAEVARLRNELRKANAMTNAHKWFNAYKESEAEVAKLQNELREANETIQYLRAELGRSRSAWQNRLSRRAERLDYVRKQQEEKNHGCKIDFGY